MNSRVEIRGELAELNFSHTVKEKEFYRGIVLVPRENGKADEVPVCISEKLKCNCEIGETYLVKGSFRSRNAVDASGKTKLDLFVFVDEIHRISTTPGLGESNPINLITMDGFVCKEPVYRKTPLGKEITDIILAVNRGNYKSSYIPCVCWSDTARFVRDCANVGTEVIVNGRIQSRVYEKKNEDGTVVEKTAYEVSISSLAIVEESEE